MGDKVFTKDVGTVIKLDTCEDISLATAHKIIAQRPDQDPVDLATDIVETTKLQHIKTADTLDEEGPWELQSYVELGGGIYHGEIAVLRIHPPIT